MVYDTVHGAAKSWTRLSAIALHNTYPINRMLFSHKKKKKGILTHGTTWVNCENIVLSEINQIK